MTTQGQGPLTNSRHVPWSGFKASSGKAIETALREGGHLHFHDLRGTAASKFYVAGLSEREIAEIIGLEEEGVSRIICRYVNRQAGIEDQVAGSTCP
jgi:hypothetical protein